MNAKISLGRSALILAGGIALTAASVAATYFAASPYLAMPSGYRTMLWFLGGAMVVTGLSAVDRRVQLFLGPGGVRYRPWGSHVVSWDEFDRFEVEYREKDRFIVPYFKKPRDVGGQSVFGFRFLDLFKSGSDLPEHCINPGPLDVEAYEIVSALESHGMTVTEAPRIY